MGAIYVATTGNDSTGTGSSGNPYATPGKAVGVASSGDDVWVKTGTYTITTSTANVAGGKIEIPSGVTVKGYGTTIGDMGSPPTLSAGAVTSINMVDLAGTYNGNESGLVNFIVDANNNSAVNCLLDNTTHSRLAFSLWLKNASDTSCYGYRSLSANNATLTKVLMQNCYFGYFSHDTGNIRMVGCHALSCIGAGFILNNTGSGCVGMMTNCIAAKTTAGPGIAGYGGVLEWGMMFHNCIAHGNYTDGWQLSSGNDMYAFANCFATGNGGYGWSGGAAGNLTSYFNCGGYGNSALRQTTGRGIVGDIPLTGVPWNNVSSNDYSPNNVAGQGALLRGLGIGVYGQADFRDAGAVQHQDSGGGSSSILLVSDW